MKKTIKPPADNAPVGSTTEQVQKSQPSQAGIDQQGTQSLIDPTESNLIMISNVRLDAITMRLLSFCWSYSKVDCLKLSNNGLCVESEKVLLDFITSPGNKISKLFFDWNPPKTSDFYFRMYKSTLSNSVLTKSSAKSPTLEFLSLRSNSMSDKDVVELCEGLKTNNALKFLDLYNNKIAQAGETSHSSISTLLRY